ncbi:unnamed protein product [Urochloa humidicola]
MPGGALSHLSLRAHSGAALSDLLGGPLRSGGAGGRRERPARGSGSMAGTNSVGSEGGRHRRGSVLEGESSAGSGGTGRRGIPVRYDGAGAHERVREGGRSGGGPTSLAGAWRGGMPDELLPPPLRPRPHESKTAASNPPPIEHGRHEILRRLRGGCRAAGAGPRLRLAAARGDLERNGGLQSLPGSSSRHVARARAMELEGFFFKVADLDRRFFPKDRAVTGSGHGARTSCSLSSLRRRWSLRSQFAGAPFILYPPLAGPARRAGAGVQARHLLHGGNERWLGHRAGRSGNHAYHVRLFSPPAKADRRPSAWVADGVQTPAAAFHSAKLPRWQRSGWDPDPVRVA